MTKSSLSVQWVGSVTAIADELWTACFPPPLEGRWWYLALERAGMEDQFQFAYGLIEQGGQAIGIAPVFLMDLPLDLVAPRPLARLLPLIPPLRFQRTLFAGSPCADEGTVGLRPGVRLDEIAPALQAALEKLAAEKGAAMVVWKDFPAETREALDGLIRPGGPFKSVSYPNTRLSIAGCTNFDDYLRLLNQDRRWKLKKKLRQSHAQGALDIDVLQCPVSSELDEMFALFRQTYLRGSVKFERLTRPFFSEIAAAGPSWFVTLRDPRGGRLVAFKLCFLLGNRLINKFIGLDYGYAGPWYLFFRLWEATVNWATAIGVEEMQSGQTGYAPKFDLGFTPVALDNTCRHRNPLLNLLLARVARHISWKTLDATLANYAQAHPEPPAVVVAPAPTETQSRRKAA